MAKSLKSFFRPSSLPAERRTLILGAVLATVLGFSPAYAVKASPKGKSEAALENYQDLIAKAQNLTLQRDRLQASQILIRALKREQRSSLAFKEMSKALTDLTTVFYTEKAQAVFAVGEAAVEMRPREALDSFQEALRLEDGNVSALIALARVHLTLGECDKADTSIHAAEAIDPYSPYVKLLGLQSLACAKSYDLLLTNLENYEGESEDPSTKNLRLGLQILALTNKAKPDLKKAKTLLATWEASDPTYPEVSYWNYQIAKLNGAPDRAAAVKYTQACQNLTARRRKNYSTDVNLCKWKDAVDTYLKDSTAAPH